MRTTLRCLMQRHRCLAVPLPSSQRSASLLSSHARSSAPPCISPLLRGYRIGIVLATQRAAYATTPSDSNGDQNNSDPDSSTAGENRSSIRSSDGDTRTPPQPSESSNHNDGSNDPTDALNYTHAPSLRDALPPSAVDLPETSFLKCIDKEIMDEKYRLDKEEGAPPIPAGWTMHHEDGTSFIYGRRVWMPPPPSSSSSSSSSSTASAAPTKGQAPSAEGEETAEKTAATGAAVTPVPRPMEKHFLRIQLTSRDASLDPECDVRGEHFPFSIFVQRVHTDTAHGEPEHREAGVDLHGDAFEEHKFYHDSIEVRCDVVDGELMVDAVVHHGASTATIASTAEATAHTITPPYANPFAGYAGPNLDEAEEEVLDGIQSWLAERGVDDQLGEFVGQYAIWVEQAEYELWLQQLRDYVAA